MLILGPKKCQHYDKGFEHSASGRRFSAVHVKRELQNGSKVDRDWIVYSPSDDSIFCFACRLFGDYSRQHSFAKTGFKDWKNISRTIKNHEHSTTHNNNYLAYKRRARELENLEDSFKSSLEIEMDYWRQILKRIVSVIKFLGSRGLPFRGSDQKIGSNENGNFLGLLELLSSTFKKSSNAVRKQRIRARIIFVSKYLRRISFSHRKQNGI